MVNNRQISFLCWQPVESLLDAETFSLALIGSQSEVAADTPASLLGKKFKNKSWSPEAKHSKSLRDSREKKVFKEGSESY